MCTLFCYGQQLHAPVGRSTSQPAYMRISCCLKRLKCLKGALAKGLSVSSLEVSEEKGSVSIMEEYQYMHTNPAKRIKMSDDERDVDVESEDENNGGENSLGSIDKRAHHNASERKRRDHIKEGFTGLREAIPTMKDGDKSSRAQILKKACDFIHYQCKKNSSNQSDKDDLKRQNDLLEAQIRALERAQLNTFVDKSAAELLNDEGLLAQGESLPNPYDLEPSVSAVAPRQSLLLSLPTPNDLETSVSVARAVAPGQSLLLKKCGFPKKENQSILGFPQEENHSMMLLESHLDF
jgi:Max protein